MSDAPAWLKSMEHGVIGESRARAFLLDRFWVLERSVDIHGADYLIQRRITETNFLDRDAPRLGIVQVKFVQEAATNIYIRGNYVEDKSGMPHEEFFLLVFSGREDDERRFLLSAKDITTSCPPKDGEDGKLYLLTGKRLIKEGEFEVTSKKRALDRIEHALRNADFLKNRKFIGASHYVKVTPDQIEHDFLLPLDNGYTDIQRAFYENKKKLQHTLFEMEELCEAMSRILRSTDPELAFQIFAREIEPYLSRWGLGPSLSINCGAFDDEDFLAVVQNHKQRLAKLKELGITEAYFDLFNMLERTVVTEVSTLKAIGEEDVVKVTVEYAAKDMKRPSITVKRSAREFKTLPSIKESQAGRHVLYFRPRDWLSWEIRAGEESAPEGQAEILDALGKGSWIFRYAFQKEVDRHLLGKELVSQWA